MRRVARRGLLQEKLFPLIGLYPWDCCLCREVRLYRRRLMRVDAVHPDLTKAKKPEQVANKPGGSVPAGNNRLASRIVT
jgi:hypothetical protein